MEVGFWREALTPSEIRKLADGAACDQVRPAALLSYMPLDRDIIDRRGKIWTDNSGGATSTLVPPRRIRRNDDAAVISGCTITGDGSAAGIGAATATGAATAAGAGSAAGAGVAAATGAATGAGVGNAAGSGVATGVGTSTAIVAGVGAADGTSTAAAVGASIGIISAVGNAAGSSEALGVSLTTGAGGEKRKRKRIEWVPPDHDIETRERTPQPGEPDEPAPDQPQHLPTPAPSVKLSKAARKLAQAVARARSADPATAERARAFLADIQANADSDLARLLAHQQAMELQRRGAQSAAAAEEEDAVRAFMQWLMRQ